MTGPKKQKSAVHQGVVPEKFPETTKESNVVDSQSADKSDNNYENVDVDVDEYMVATSSEMQRIPHFAHDMALEIQRLRKSGIKTRVHLLNFILHNSKELIDQSDFDPKYSVRKAELVKASKELKLGYRKLQDFIKLQGREQELFESLHSVLAGAFLIGLASDASGLSVSDAKKFAGSIFAANARKYAKKAADERAEKFTEIVRIAIPIAFQRHEILKKLSNSDQSAHILMPIVEELATEYVKEERGKGNSGEIVTNMIRRAIKRITGGKRGGIRKGSPEFREPIERSTPV